MATGASFEELREAWAWLNGDEALMGEGRPLHRERGSRNGSIFWMPMRKIGVFSLMIG
jgi:hypothetical protein